MKDTTKHQSGFISIIGNPNVGKSTLMNALVGTDLSIITSKAQTTRHRILGIVNGPHFQMVLSDTPGVIKPAYEMQNSMMNFVKEALVDADVLIYMVTVDETELKDEKLFERIKKSKAPLFVLINKIDLSSQELVEKTVAHWQSIFPKARVCPISALTGFFIPELLELMIELLPDSPPYFPKDQLTDKPERFFVNESIREQILQRYDKEIPYAVEVSTEEFHESPKIIKIRSVIMVERETQKGILIGHKGSALKNVGIGARKSLQDFFGKKIHLELYVKVSKNWRSNTQQLKRFGYHN
ncbi:GTPase Era [Flavobacteriaceae bacterium]|nr:GTPase Era [Flavobacteriaceae bacterium]MDA8877755.1 GTPase Era [Flavobacteriaceae bacterium]MDA9852141.1 GTPase Era [Flavobacteriaceae bacterium]MDC0386180.1 GTPase Era [Flavobacteriaceae bacterium]MDC0872087.1 GTPase Era [Flavobacteriaceae bacterium]